MLAYKDVQPAHIELGVKTYTVNHPNWCKQFDTFYNDTKQFADPESRMLKILDLVSKSGWNMNRRGQCRSIAEMIQSNIITQTDLVEFWSVVDSLSPHTLRDVPIELMSVFNNILTKKMNWENRVARTSIGRLTAPMC